MKILFLGDVVGKVGRIAVKQHLDTIKNTYSPDAIIINGENATHAF